MNKCAIVDSNELCYIALHSQNYLSYEGRPTGVVFGFLRKLLDLVKLFGHTNFIFCFDSSISYRKISYPQYKEKRFDPITEDKMEAYIYGKEQFAIIRKHVLPSLGFKNIFFKTGFESDDLIAYICKNWQFKYFTVVSSDEDLYQLLSPTVTIYKPRAKKFFSDSQYRKTYGIKPSQWVDVKAIAGCKSDNVKGVEGIGEKTAVEFLKGNLSKGKKYEAIMYSYHKIKRNLDLVELPHKELTGNGIKWSQNIFNYENFIRIFDYYGFASFLKPPLNNVWHYCFFKKHLR